MPHTLAQHAQVRPGALRGRRYSARVPRPCRVGVQLPEVERHVPWPELLSMARAAEDAGFDSLGGGAHLLYDLAGGLPRGPGEAGTSRAAPAVATRRVEIGPLVASTSFHAPA